jgi:P27 family predicted phage terminase small subunit
MAARKPVELKRRHGRGPGLDAAGRRLPQPVIVLPSADGPPIPPIPLNDVGRRAWDELWSSVPWLSETDARAVARLCVLYERHAMLVAQVDRDGPLTHGIRNQPRPNPLLATLSALETEIRLLEQQAGLTPASRAALGMVEVRRVSGLDEMVRRRRRLS